MLARSTVPLLAGLMMSIVPLSAPMRSRRRSANVRSCKYLSGLIPRDILILCDLRVLGCLTTGHTELSLSSVTFLRRRVTIPGLRASLPVTPDWEGACQPGIDPAEASRRVSSVREATPSLR